MKNQSTIILKITFFKQVKSLFWFFLFSCTWFGGSYYCLKDVDFTTVSKNIIAIMIGVVLIFAYATLPALFFHIDYLIRNWKEEYEIGNGKIIKRKKGIEKIYLFEEISDVFLYLSPPDFAKNILHNNAYDNYHFAKIVMKSGEELFLTSLLYQSGGIEKILKNHIKGVPYWREKRRLQRCTR